MKQCLILLGLLCLTLAVQDNFVKQGDLNAIDELTSSLRENSLARAILSLAELQGKSQQVDFGKLFTALDELEESIKTSQDDEKVLFDKDYTQYLADTQFYENQVTQFKNEVAQHEVDLSELNDAQVSSETRLDIKRNELGSTQKLRNSVTRQLEDGQKIFDAQNADYVAAVDALDKAISLIDQLKAGSFIEQDSFKETTTQLQRRISAINSQRILYQPLIEALIQLTQQKYFDQFFIIIINRFADQQLVSQVQNLLNELRKQLNDSRLSLANQYENEKQRNDDIAAEYDSLLSNLSTITIPELQTNIQIKVGEIQTKKTLLSDANSNFNTAQTNFDATEAAWIQRQADNRSLTDEYRNELVVISQTRQVLDRGGVRKD